MIFIFILQACSYFKPKHDANKKWIAKVNAVYLYEEDIKTILPKEYTKIDSSLLVSNYINSWAKQQLLFDKAKINLKENQDEIQNLVDKYKQDLLINKYKEAIVSQDLDTLILENEISNFYKENMNIFKLNEKLTKFKYLQIGYDILDKDKIEKLFKSNKKEDTYELMKNELIYKSFHFNDSTWVKYKDLLKLVPILNENENKIKPNKFLKIEDSVNVYYLKIKSVLKRNQIAPQSYVESTIKQMILHNRKLLLLKNIEKTLLSDATKNGKYEINN